MIPLPGFRSGRIPTESDLVALQNAAAAQQDQFVFFLQHDDRVSQYIRRERLPRCHTNEH